MSNNQGDIQQATSYITSLQQQPGYIPAIMLIVDDMQIDTSVRQAALASLKNTVMRYWNNQQNQECICQSDKVTIRGNILRALIRVINVKQLQTLYS